MGLNYALASQPDLNPEHINFTAQFTNTSNVPVSPDSSVYNLPAGTTGRIAINASFEEEGFFENGVIKVTNTQHPVVVNANNIFIDPDFVSSTDLVEDGTLTLNIGQLYQGKFITVPLDFTQSYSNFQTSPDFFAGDMDVSIEGNWNNNGVITPIRKTVPLRFEFTASIISEPIGQLDFKSHTDSNILAAYTLDTGVPISNYGSVGRAGIEDSTFNIDFPLINGQAPTIKSVAFSSVKTNNAPTSATTMNQANWTTKPDGTGIIITRSAYPGRGIMAYGSSTNFRLYTVKISLEYPHPGSEYMTAHGSESFDLTGQLTLVPFNSNIAVPVETSVGNLTIPATLGEPVGDIALFEPTILSNNATKVTSRENYMENRHPATVGYSYKLTTVSTAVSGPMALDISDYTYEVESNPGVAVPLTNEDICTSTVSVSTTIVFTNTNVSNVFGDNGWIKIFDADDPSSDPQPLTTLKRLPSPTVSSYTVPADSGVCRLRLETSTPTVDNKPVTINSEEVLSDTFAQKLSAQNQSLELSNVTSYPRLSSMLEGEYDFTNVANNSIAFPVPYNLARTNTPSFYPGTNANVTSTTENTTKTINIRFPTANTTYGYAENPVFYYEIPKNFIVEDFSINPITDQYSTSAAYNNPITIPPDDIILERYTIANESTILKMTVPGIYENKVGTNYYQFWIDVSLRVSPANTTTGNVTTYLWMEADNGHYGTPVADTKDVNNNGNVTELLERPAGTSLVASKLSTMIGITSTIDKDGNRHGPPAKSQVYPDDTVTLKAEIINNNINTTALDVARGFSTIIRLPRTGNKGFNFDGTTNQSDDLGSEFNAYLKPARPAENGEPAYTPITSPTNALTRTGTYMYYTFLDDPAEFTDANGDHVDDTPNNWFTWNRAAPHNTLKPDGSGLLEDSDYKNIRNILITTTSSTSTTVAYSLSQKAIYTLNFDVEVDSSAQVGQNTHFTFWSKNKYPADPSRPDEYPLVSEKAGIQIELATSVAVDYRVVDTAGTPLTVIPNNPMFRVVLTKADDSSKTVILTTRGNQTVRAFDYEYGTYNVSVLPETNYMTPTIYRDPEPDDGIDIDESTDPPITQITIDEDNSDIYLVVMQRFNNPYVHETYLNINNTNEVRSPASTEIRTDLNQNTYSVSRTDQKLHIENWVPVSYRIGTGSPVSFDTVTTVNINNITSDHTVTYYYDTDTNNNGRRDSEDGRVTEKFQDLSGNEVRPTTTNVRGLHGDYSRTMAPTDTFRWVYLGYLLDSTNPDDLVASSTAALTNLTNDHEITYIYKKAQVPVTVNYLHGTDTLATFTAENQEVDSIYNYDPPELFTDSESGKSFRLKPDQPTSLTVLETNVLNFQYRSTDASLSSVSVDEGGISPEFDKDTFSYDLKLINQTNITINATAEDPAATIVGTGVKSLIPGTNTFLITVTAEDTVTKQVYTIEAFMATLSLSIDDNVSMNITGSGQSQNYLDAKVTTTNPLGYTLDFRAASSDLVCTDSELDPQPTIPTIVDSGPLSQNRWGWSATTQSLFTPTTWHPIPVNSSSLIGSSGDPSGPANDGASSDLYYLYFGLRHDYSLSPCTYTQSIIVTLLPN